jgi:hypothetical protein
MAETVKEMASSLLFCLVTFSLYGTMQQRAVTKARERGERERKKGGGEASLRAREGTPRYRTLVNDVSHGARCKTRGSTWLLLGRRSIFPEQHRERLGYKSASA